MKQNIILIIVAMIVAFTEIGWPVPYTTRDEDTVEVIYIDHNHLHMAGNVDTGAGANF